MEFNKSGFISVFHITCVMHNARVSQRMIDYHVKRGEPEYLSSNEEEKLIEIICKIIKEDNLQILSLNICADHLHFVIECESNKLTTIVGKIKSKSAREFNIWRGITMLEESNIQEPKGHLTMGAKEVGNDEKSNKTTEQETMGHAPLSKDYAPLAKQKRGKNYNSFWAQKFNRVEIVTDKQLYNVIEYIENNRIKHNLSPLPNRSFKLIKNILVDYDTW